MQLAADSRSSIARTRVSLGVCRGNRAHIILFLGFAFSLSALAQLNQNCTVSVLNRTVPVNADGSWVLPNIPANFGQVKARATCVQNGVTIFGESGFFTVPANQAVNLPAITLGTITPIPVSLAIATSGPSLTSAGQTTQLVVTATYPDGSTKDVTAASAGTNYTVSNSAIATITAGGLVTAVSSGTVVIQANNEGGTGIATVPVALGGAMVGGIPVSWIVAHGLNPNDPLVPFEDPDRDGLTNLQEFQIGTDPKNPDTDGDGLTDGDEVNKYHTNPLLADTDGDLIPDGVEVQTGTDPTDPRSYDLKKATATSTVSPPSFTLTTSIANPVVSVQLNWKVTLIDGKTTLDLTTDRRTSFSSSNVNVCSLGASAGLIFSVGTGSCIITISQNTLNAAVSGAVQSFAPTPLSFLPIPGFANNVKVNGNYAYIAAGSAGLQIVDVTNRASPKIVSSLALPSNANDLRVKINTVYMATSAGLSIIDVSRPLAPKLLGSVSTPNTAWDVAVSGNLAYIAAGTAGLQIANVSNPASPSIVGSLSISGGVAKGVALAGNYAVIAASSAGVVIANITNSASPQFLGSVATPGDARKVAVKGSTAFIADYPVSMQVVDFSNPSSPTIVATTTDSLGGKLQDVTVASVLGATLTFGADVFFTNGVPIVDVTDPTNPVPRAILDFSKYRDDNGHGIDVDLSYVYMTGEEGTITDLGTTGDTRLYIGQYNQIVDNGGIPPAVQITFPTPTTTLIQGQTITLSANATDDIAVASVNFLVNGQVVFTTSSQPYQFTFIVPVTATTLTLGATAVDYGNNVGTAPNVVVPVIPDPLTTVKGQVSTKAGIAVSGATVSALGISGSTASDGTFSIPGVPTIRGPIIVDATGIVAGVKLAGSSAPTPPVTGGITNVGIIQVGPRPLLTSLSPKSALAGTAVASMVVNGANLTGSTFTFSPASAVVITNTTIASDGNSATLSLNIPGTAIGTFALVASNDAGNSGTDVTQPNRFTAVDPNSTADTDGDGFQDVIEAVFGTDPLDPKSFPVIPAATETESVAFSVLNAPVTGAGSTETESVSFSVLNSPITGAGITETESVAFSVLNAPVTGAGSTEAESTAFSVLNAPAGTSGISESESVYFSVNNLSTGQQSKTQSFGKPPSTSGGTHETNGEAAQPQARPAPPPVDPLLDSDGDGLPDWFELLIGTDPHKPDTDGDGLTDFEEVFVYHTNPLNPDTDGDGFDDGIEIVAGSDPLDPNSTPLTVASHARVTGFHAGDVKVAAVRTEISRKAKKKGDAHVKKHSEELSRKKAANGGLSGGFNLRSVDR